MTPLSSSPRMMRADNFEAAFLTIRPLGTGGWGQRNFWTASVPGWGISAPSVRELVQMLRDWFAQENDDG